MSMSLITDLSRHFRAFEADIMKAAAATLNSTVYEAREKIIQTSKRTFDRPKEWSTSKAYLFTKAKPADGARMFGELRAKPEQAKVLHYQIDGGIRRKGDPGATRYDVPVGADAAHTDAFGGIARGALKKVAKVAAKEKKDRRTVARPSCSSSRTAPDRNVGNAARPRGAPPEAVEVGQQVRQRTRHILRENRPHPWLLDASGQIAGHVDPSKRSPIRTAPRRQQAEAHPRLRGPCEVP
ncbi:hypothetical protein HB770_04210 [Rhizobium leguminosarum bv. viciae]|uniref:Uncharacterized protein n=1 Tax=Rhizobium leguminosarum bv. viciae TaxID=387 RepID=A0A7G6RHW7_RHILV|nr:hypothetical protein HB770_04210 [Rhizobium leguminosarum bv. viciae]